MCVKEKILKKMVLLKSIKIKKKPANYFQYRVFYTVILFTYLPIYGCLYYYTVSYSTCVYI